MTLALYKDTRMFFVIEISRLRNIKSVPAAGPLAFIVHEPRELCDLTIVP